MKQQSTSIDKSLIKRLVRYSWHTRNSGSSISYLVLSLLSGILETGMFTAALKNQDLSLGMATVLAYQLGCLARNPLRVSLHAATLILCCSLPLIIWIDNSWLLLLVTVLLISAGIQGAREWLMPKERPIPVSRKRLVRVSGFICGILAGWLVNSSHLVFILAIVAILTILILNTRWKRSSAWFNWNGCWYSDRFGWIMLLHQIHYFAYAYVLLSILLITPTIPQSRTIWLHPVTAALWFSSGWLSYISGEWLLRDRFELSARQASIVGHTWVAICLVGMIFLRDYTSALAAVWVIGGFGGGSVYAIKELAKSASSRIDIELWEHWGHVMGVALALVSVVIWPCYLEIPFIIALGAALSTLFLLVLQDVQIRIPG